MGSLSFAVVQKSSAALDLTTDSTDWAYGAGSSSFKAPGPTTIDVPGGGAGFGGFGRTVSATDGTSTPGGGGVSFSSSSGFYREGTGNPWVIVVPAGTAAQKLSVSFGAFRQLLGVSASLSDASASAIADESTIDYRIASGEFGAAHAEIVFAADADGEELTVTIYAVASESGGTVNYQASKLEPSSGGASDVSEIPRRTFPFAVLNH